MMIRGSVRPLSGCSDYVLLPQDPPSPSFEVGIVLGGGATGSYGRIGFWSYLGGILGVAHLDHYASSRDGDP